MEVRLSGIWCPTGIEPGHGDFTASLTELSWQREVLNRHCTSRQPNFSKSDSTGKDCVNRFFSVFRQVSTTRRQRAKQISSASCAVSIRLAIHQHSAKPSSTSSIWLLPSPDRQLQLWLQFVGEIRPALFTIGQLMNGGRIGKTYRQR